MAARSRRFAAQEAIRRLLVDIDSDDSSTDENDIDIQVSDQSSLSTSDEEPDVDIPEAQINLDSLSSEFRAPDGTVWTKVSCSETRQRAGRTPIRNVIRHNPGVTRFMMNRVDEEKDIFLELFGRNWIRHIRDFTIAEARKQGNDNFSLTDEELLSFIGLSIIRGVLKGKNEPLSSFWSAEYGRSIFNDTMSRNKFILIKRYIRFDDKSTRPRRRETDKFAAIRDLWETAMDRCRSSFNPGAQTTVDEQLFPCKCRCPFIQYMSNKPDKFGLKFWMICDVATKYVMNAIPYLGKIEQRAQNTSVPEYVVMQLTEPYHGSGISVTTDNFFTSASLGNRLLSKNVTLLGTVRHNRREIPKEIMSNLEKNNVPVYSSSFYKSGNLFLAAYKVKSKKTVLILSTQHKTPNIDQSNPKKKPEMVVAYNSTKFGVDTCDQMLRYYSTKSATRRWPLSVFYNLMDILCLNAFVLAKEMRMKNANSRREFLLFLGKQLCTGKSRQSTQRQNFSDFNQPSGNLFSTQRFRCCLCKSNKTRETCSTCSKFVCGSCSKRTCGTCAYD